MVEHEEVEALWRSRVLKERPGIIIEVEHGKRCLIDEWDWPIIQHIDMWMDKKGYICMKHEGWRYLHNYLMQFSDPEYPVDHWNGIPWDNRRSNLRVITRSHNLDRSRRLSEEEARILDAYQDGKLDINIHEWLREHRNRGKL